MRPYRKERVASAVQTIVSQSIAQRLNDPRVSPLTTVTRVEVTGDLLIARVYVSIPGDETAERKTMAALQHAAGFVQNIVARELSMRQCPEVRFFLDEALKGARKTLAILDENRRNRPKTADEGESDEVGAVVDEWETEPQGGENNEGSLDVDLDGDETAPGDGVGQRQEGNT